MMALHELGDVLTPRLGQPVDRAAVYPLAGVRGFGRGLLLRDVIPGSGTKYGTLTRLSEGNVVYSKIKAFEGAVTVVPPEGEGYFVSPEFPVFTVAAGVEAAYLRHVLAWEGFADQLRSRSSGIGARRERVAPSTFLRLNVPLPDIDEQRRIAAHLDAVGASTGRSLHACRICVQTVDFALESVVGAMLDAQKQPVGEILHLERRAANVEPDETVTEIGVRSFGKGLFIKPPVTGELIGSKRVFTIRRGDLVVSNIFAWEGAIAVAEAVHDGLIGSHRFMTWVPKSRTTEARYLQLYLSSAQGLRQLRAASPGSAGRNRTLSIKSFEEIEIPLPGHARQLELIQIAETILRAVKNRRIAESLSRALLPAARNEIFSAML